MLDGTASLPYTDIRQELVRDLLQDANRIPCNSQEFLEYPDIPALGAIIKNRKSVVNKLTLNPIGEKLRKYIQFSVCGS